jgi:hypothetical protein
VPVLGCVASIYSGTYTFELVAALISAFFSSSNRTIAPLSLDAAEQRAVNPSCQSHMIQVVAAVRQGGRRGRAREEPKLWAGSENMARERSANYGAEREVRSFGQSKLLHAPDRMSKISVERTQFAWVCYAGIAGWDYKGLEY